MALELISKNARLLSGLPCIYHLGICTLYSEDVREDGECFTFDPEKTCCLVFALPDASGSQAYSVIRGFGPAIPLKPTFLRVGKTAAFVSDCSDPTVIAFCKRVMSGLVIAKDMPKIPPNEVN
jgi:hypothetical protein